MKKLCSTLLVIIISLSMATTAFAALSEPSSWAKDDVAKQLERGVGESLKGRYQDNITRAEFARLVIEWLTAELDGDLEVLVELYMPTPEGGHTLPTYGGYSDGNSSLEMINQSCIFRDAYAGTWWLYNDMPKDSYYDSLYVAYATIFGIVSGVGNNNFSPNGSLTREQAAVIIMRTFMVLDNYNGGKIYNDEKHLYAMARFYHGGDWPYPEGFESFADIDIVSTWAVGGVNFMKYFSIMSGTGNNCFSPKANYTIEQAIVTLSRIN